MRTCRCGAQLERGRKKCDSCVALRGNNRRESYHSIERAEAEARARRIAEVMAKEPELEPWQLQERFQLSAEELAAIRIRIARSADRKADA